jgi:hypothetical protein
LGGERRTVAYPDGWDGEADFAADGAVGAMAGGGNGGGLGSGRAWGRRLQVVVLSGGYLDLG